MQIVEIAEGGGVVGGHRKKKRYAPFRCMKATGICLWRGISAVVLFLLALLCCGCICFPIPIIIPV